MLIKSLHTKAGAAEAKKRLKCLGIAFTIAFCWEIFEFFFAGEPIHTEFMELALVPHAPFLYAHNCAGYSHAVLMHDHPGTLSCVNTSSSQQELTEVKIIPGAFEFSKNCSHWLLMVLRLAFALPLACMASD